MTFGGGPSASVFIGALLEAYVTDVYGGRKQVGELRKPEDVVVQIRGTSPDHLFSTHFGSILIHSLKILGFEIRTLIKYLLLRHSCPFPSKNVPNCDPEASNTRLAGSLPRF